MALPFRMHRSQPWQRLTLLDLLLLQASFGLGFSLVCWLYPGEAGAPGRVITGVVFGAVFAGPTILLAQWTLRGRSRPLSAGEWLWLSPPLLFGLLWCSLRIPLDWYSEHLFGAWIFAQITFIGVALATLFSGFRGYRSTVPCYWTDRTGSWVSLLFGLWVFFFVVPAVLLD